MKTKKVGKITLALSLIILGTLLFISNFIQLDVVKLLSIYWPSVIIILGLELIALKFLADRKKDDVKLGVDGISLTVLLVIVFLSLFITGISRIAANIEILPNIIMNYKYESDFDKTFEIDADGKDEIYIDNSFGDVEIRTGEGNNIRVSAQISIKHNDMEFAENIAENIINIDGDYENKVYIKSQHYRFLQDKSKVKQIAIKYSIIVPERFKADIVNAYGPVTVDGIQGELIITNKHGNVIAKNIAKDTKIENSFGKVEVFNIKGHIEIRNRHGKVEAIEVYNGLDIFNVHGEIDVKSVKGDINIENLHDEINISKVEGNAKVNGEFSGIEVENVDGNVEVSTSHEDINIVNVTGFVIANNSFDSIKVKEASKRVELKNRHGDILFETSQIVGNDVTIDNEHGDIVIDILKEQQGQFQVFTEYGEIKDSFGFAIKEEVNRESITQSIGEKSVYFYLTTRHGDILIK